jgi:hypothetical protein
MIREEIRSASVHANVAVQRRELWDASEPLLDRRRPEQHDDPRRHEIDLPVEPVLQAPGQFIFSWCPILRRAALYAA